MTKNWSFAKITNILLNKVRSVIVSQNHYLNKILDVHPLWNAFDFKHIHKIWLYIHYVNILVVKLDKNNKKSKMYMASVVSCMQKKLDFRTYFCIIIFSTLWQIDMLTILVGEWFLNCIVGQGTKNSSRIGRIMGIAQFFQFGEIFVCHHNMRIFCGKCVFTKSRELCKNFIVIQPGLGTHGTSILCLFEVGSSRQFSTKWLGQLNFSTKYIGLSAFFLHTENVHLVWAN